MKWKTLKTIPPSVEKDSDKKEKHAESNLVIKKCRYYDKGYFKYLKKNFPSDWYVQDSSRTTEM